MEFIFRSGSSVNSRRDGQLGEYLYRMSVRILIRILCLLQSVFFSGTLNPGIELNNADPKFFGGQNMAYKSQSSRKTNFKNLRS